MISLFKWTVNASTVFSSHNFVKTGEGRNSVTPAMFVKDADSHSLILSSFSVEFNLHIKYLIALIEPKI